MEEFSRDETGRGRLLVSADDHERIFFAWDRGDLDSTCMSLRPADVAEQALLRQIRWEDIWLGCARKLGLHGGALLARERRTTERGERSEPRARRRRTPLHGVQATPEVGPDAAGGAGRA